MTFRDTDTLLPKGRPAPRGDRALRPLRALTTALTLAGILGAALAPATAETLGNTRSSAAERAIGAFQCTGMSQRKTDGCSHPLNGLVTREYKRQFRSACVRHDACYSSPFRLAGKSANAGQKACDKAFLSDMRAICDRDHAGIGGGRLVARASCHAAALSFFIGVDRFGTQAFREGQKWASRSCRVTRPAVPSTSIVVRNHAGFVAQFNALFFRKDGSVVTRESGRFPVLDYREIKLDGEIRQAHVFIKGDVVGQLKFDVVPGGADRCYAIKGTIFRARVVDCAKALGG